MERKPRRNLEDTSETLNQMELLMEWNSHVDLRECRELFAEAGKFPPCLQKVCTGKGSVSSSKGAARGGWQTLKHQGHEEETNLSESMKVQEPKTTTVVKGEAARVCAYQVGKWGLL